MRVRGHNYPIRAFTWAYVAWSLAPVAVAILYSFNAGRSRSAWQGFSLRWYTWDPGSLLHDPTLRHALGHTLVLASLSSVFAVTLGAELAIAMARWRSTTAKATSALVLSTLVTPEIILGLSLLLVFGRLYTFIPLGTWAQLAGLVTFGLAVPFLVVRGRLSTLGRSFEEAAMDLGASPAQTLRRVLLPLLAPALVASVLLVFAAALDDLVVSSFLSSDASTETVPIILYNTVRGTSTPALNALASFLLLITILAGASAALVQQSASRGSATPAGSLESPQAG